MPARWAIGCADGLGPGRTLKPRRLTILIADRQNNLCRVAASTRRPATLLDIARVAGVHVSTVSKALSGSPQLNIRPETRERIEQAAIDLKYRPNAAGRALRLASTGALGMLVPSL